MSNNANMRDVEGGYKELKDGQNSTKEKVQNVLSNILMIVTLLIFLFNMWPLVIWLINLWWGEDRGWRYFQVLATISVIVVQITGFYCLVMYFFTRRQNKRLRGEKHFAEALGRQQAEQIHKLKEENARLLGLNSSKGYTSDSSNALEQVQVVAGSATQTMETELGPRERRDALEEAQNSAQIMEDTEERVRRLQRKYGK